MTEPSASHEPIPALTPRGAGHQFVLYGDCCSGVPGAPHEATFAAVNATVERLSPPPEFIIFPGDEVIGLTSDEAALRAQWQHWLEVEMAWLDRQAIPLFHTTANHTAYDAMSSRVFADMLDYLPRNGPPGQEGLSYSVRRGDLLLVFVNTMTLSLGGEGHVETEWLAQSLRSHADARFKIVVGHHPVFPINGYSGSHQRQIGSKHAGPFWQTLVNNGVFAYLCSHMLAFDVQVHQGVLQIMTAGAGTSGLMPEDSEYHHCVQASLDDEGLRYLVIDTAGTVRERLSWPLNIPPTDGWAAFPSGEQSAPSPLTAWRFTGIAETTNVGPPQTFVSGWNDGPDLAPLWIGLTGRTQRLTVIIRPEPNNSPHIWLGPELAGGEDFDVHVAIHSGMGPGGILWRYGEDQPWSSLQAASSWGAERLSWPAHWTVGYGKQGQADQPFLGQKLRATVARLSYDGQ